MIVINRIWFLAFAKISVFKRIQCLRQKSRGNRGTAHTQNYGKTDDDHGYDDDDDDDNNANDADDDEKSAYQES